MEKRELSHAQAAAVVAGSMVGVGIFLNPPTVERALGSGLGLAAWFVGGLVALAGALCSAELGTRYPRAGGEVVYLREAFGRPWAFASGWLCVLAVMSGSIASLAVATCTYQLPTLLGISLSGDWIALCAVALVFLSTWLNIRGVGWSGRVQLALTAIPILLLVAASLYALFAGAHSFATVYGAEGSWKLPSLAIISAAYLPIYFTYSGWNAATYVAGEVKDPDRGLPRALIIGTGLVMLVYLLLIVGFSVALGSRGVAGAFEVGTAAAKALFGDWIGRLIAALILVNILTTINGTVLVGSRVIYAMAESGQFPRAGGRLTARGAPANALWFQFLWTVLLIASGPINAHFRWTQKAPYDLLLSYTTSAMLITGALSVLSLVVIRRRDPKKAAYSTWGYPVTPAFFLLSSCGVLAALLASGSSAAIAGLLVLFVGLAVGYFFSRRSPS